MGSSVCSNSRKKSALRYSVSGSYGFKYQSSMTDISHGSVRHWHPRSLISTWTLVVLLVASQSEVVLAQYTTFSMVAPSIPQPFGTNGSPFPSFLHQVHHYTPYNAVPGITGLTSTHIMPGVPSHDVYVVSATPSLHALPFDEDLLKAYKKLSPRTPFGAIPSLSLAGLPSYLPFDGIHHVSFTSGPFAYQYGGLHHVSFNSAPMAIPVGGMPSVSIIHSPSPLSLKGLSSVSFTSSPTNNPYVGMPTTPFASSQATFSLAGTPSMPYANSLPDPLFGGAPSRPIMNQQSAVPFTGQPIVGAYADPNQMSSLMQGFGGLQANQPQAATYANYPQGYPQMIMPSQFNVNAATNPPSTIGATGAQYKFGPEQINNVSQAQGLNSDFLREYLKGLKDGFEASHSHFQSAHSLWGYTPILGTPEVQMINAARERSICDYAKHNCPPTYPPSSSGQYPLPLELSMGIHASPEWILQQGANNIPMSTEANQAPMGVSPSQERLLQYAPYKTPQSVEAFVSASQSPTSFQQQTPQTLASPTLPPAVDSQIYTNQQLLSSVPPPDNSPVNTSSAPNGFPEKTEQIKMPVA